MKKYFLLLIISYIFEIDCSCGKECMLMESPHAEECFSKEVTLDGFGEGDVNDFSCCFVKINESFNSQCFVLENSRISTIAR